MMNYLKCVDSIVGFIGLSLSYAIVSYFLMPIIEPYIIEGWIGFVQIFVIGFSIGFGGTSLIFYIKENMKITKKLI
jgi:hypothetical protein